MKRKTTYMVLFVLIYSFTTWFLIELAKLLIQIEMIWKIL